MEPVLVGRTIDFPQSDPRGKTTEKVSLRSLALLYLQLTVCSKGRDQTHSGRHVGYKDHIIDFIGASIRRERAGPGDGAAALRGKTVPCAPLGSPETGRWRNGLLRLA